MRGAIRVWLALGVALALGFSFLSDHLWVLALAPLSLWAIAGPSLLVLQWLWRAEGRVRLELREEGVSRPRRPLRRNAITVVAGVLAFIPLTQLGSWLTERARFLWYRSAYDSVVASVARGVTPRPARVEYTVDEGPPIRVAFVWPGGIIDNWCGAVHDPSGEVLKVNALQVGSPKWRGAALTKLFGGDMTACRRLSGEYYLCCFT